MNHPSFQLDSTRPIPIVEKIYRVDLNPPPPPPVTSPYSTPFFQYTLPVENICFIDINQFDALRINKHQLKTLRHLSIPEDFDFNSLPKSLIELDIQYLNKKLIPNCLPPHLSHLAIKNVGTHQSLNTPGIFPDTLESLAFYRSSSHDYSSSKDRYKYSMKEALQPNILPSSLKHLKTNYLFEKHTIGENVLP